MKLTRCPFAIVRTKSYFLLVLRFTVTKNKNEKNKPRKDLKNVFLCIPTLQMSQDTDCVLWQNNIRCWKGGLLFAFNTDWIMKTVEDSFRLEVYQLKIWMKVVFWIGTRLPARGEDRQLPVFAPRVGVRSVVDR